MWKFIRYTIYIGVLAAALIAVYNVRAFIIVPKAAEYLSKVSNHKITIENFYFSPVQGGLAVTGLSVDNRFYTDRMLIRFSIVKIVKNIKKPINYIKQIVISRATLDFQGKGADSGFSEKNVLENTPFTFPGVNAEILIDETEIKTPEWSVKLSSSQATLTPAGIKTTSVIYLYNIPVNLTVSMEKKEESVFNTQMIIFAEKEAESLIDIKGEINLSNFDFSQKIYIEKMFYKGFEISDSSGSIVKTGKNLNAGLSGEFGSIVFKSENLIDFTSAAKIDLSKINKDLGAEVDYNLIQKDGEGKIEFNIQNLKIYDFQLGSFKMDGIRQKDGLSNLLCDYGNGNKIEIAYKRGIYSVLLFVSKKSAGSVSGNLITGEVSADINNMDVSKLPIIPFISKDAKGKVNVKGSIDENNGEILFTLKDLKTGKIDKTDLYGSIKRNGAMYVFDFYKSDKTVVFNSVVQEGSLLSTDFKFINTDMENIFRAFGYTKGRITGKASGRIKYAKDTLTDFDIRAFDGMLYNNKFSKLEAKGSVDLRKINIEHFMMKDSNNNVTAYASGLLGFTARDPESALTCRFKKIDIGGAVVSGDIAFNGDIDGKNEIKGTVTSPKITVSGVDFANFTADTLISSKRVSINGITAENGLKGNLNCAISQKNTLSGNIQLKNTDIKGFYPNLTGNLNAALKISGSLNNPVLSLSASVRKGTLSKLPFSFVSDITYKNNILSVKKAEFNSEKSNVSFKGEYSKKGKIQIDFKNINEKFFNRFVGFRTPVTGDFSGKGTLSVKRDKNNLNMVISSTNTYVKGIKLNSLKTNIGVYGNTISVSSAYAKIADSEVRAEKGKFNIKTGKYSLNLQLVNTHIGPANVFGNAVLTGTMNKIKGGSVYNGNVKLQNLWINRYKLEEYTLAYTVKNKTLSLLSKEKDANKLKISGNFDFDKKISVDNLKISKNAAVLDLGALFEGDKAALNIDGKNLDLEFLCEAFDLPVDMEGTTNLRATMTGLLKEPEIKVSLNSKTGTLMDIPYDSIDIDIASSKNIATINMARFYKRGEIDISATGKFPFWIDSSVTQTMIKAPIAISYELEDSKMQTLKYFSKEHIRPRSGKMTVKGTVTGTNEQIKNSGQLLISGGVFDSKGYFDRVKDFSVDISWLDNLVTVNKLTGKCGPGRFNVTGDLEIDSNAQRVDSFNLRVFTDNKGIFLRVPELPLPSSILSRTILKDFSSGEPKFDITITGTSDKPVFTGNITLENTRFSYPSTAKTSGESILPDATELNLTLLTGKNTKFENSYISAWINGSLALNGPLSDIKANGVIDTQRGSIQYLGINFDILNAKIEIVDSTYLYVSGEAETKVSSLTTRNESETIRMAIDKSEVSNLNVRFYSKDDPTMDSQTALAKATRTNPEDSDASNQLMGLSDFVLRQQALRLIDSTFATPLARTVLRRTGVVDNFKVSYVPQDQDLSATEDMSFSNLFYGTKYSLEKNLTNQFLLGYSVTFDQIEKKLDLKHELEMRYRLSNNFFLSGSYELESEESLHQPDRRLMLQHQFRFGLPGSKKNKSSDKGE